RTARRQRAGRCYSRWTPARYRSRFRTDVVKREITLVSWASRNRNRLSAPGPQHFRRGLILSGNLQEAGATPNRKQRVFAASLLGEETPKSFDRLSVDVQPRPLC